MLHVGTNNHQNSAEEICEGIFELIEIIKEKLPDVYVVVPVSTKESSFCTKTVHFHISLIIFVELYLLQYLCE